MEYRKFEIWEYDATKCEEATRHLNEMSLRGYELIGISNYFSMAGYVKTEDAHNKKYSVVINDTDKEADNTNLIYMDSKEGVSIYCSEGELPKYDDDEAFINLKNNLLRKGRNGNNSIYSAPYLLLLIFASHLYRNISVENFSDIWFDMLPSLLINSIGILVILFIGLRNQIKKRNLFMLQGFVSFENFKYEKIKVYKQRYKGIPYILFLMVILIIVFCTYSAITGSDPLITISVIIAIIGVVMILSSLYFSLIKLNSDYEKGFALLGVILVFLSVLFSNSILGLSIVLMGVFIFFL